jgi:acyl-coenzyme A thioesterase PaaI-like protein
MADSVFTLDGDRIAPTEHARGPWDPRALHGGAPAALIAAAFERMEPGAELGIARLSFEFLRPIPLAPLTLSTRVVRPGRRVQELAAELSAVTHGPPSPSPSSALHEVDGVSELEPAGRELICRASALRVREIGADVPASRPHQRGEGSERPAPSATPVEAAMSAPSTGKPARIAFNDSADASFGTTGMEMSWLSDPWHQGPGRVWMRLREPILPGEQTTPLARLVATADFGNGVSAELPFDRFVFINADLTIHLQREPRGEWIGLDARTLLQPGGMGLAESALYDEHGAVGRAFQTLVVQAR